MELVYQYLTGPKFRHRVEAIVEKFSDMLSASLSMMTSLRSCARYGGTPLIHIPFFFEAAILSRMALVHDLALELCKGQQNSQGQAPHRARWLAAVAKRLFRPIEPPICIRGRQQRHLAVMAEGKNVTAP